MTSPAFKYNGSRKGKEDDVSERELAFRPNNKKSSLMSTTWQKSHDSKLVIRKRAKA